jgi:predicted site-specific integrase-resolvase
MENIFVKTKEAADFLQISHKTMEKWRVVGGGPRYFKAGGRVLYNKAELEAWILGRSHESTSDQGQVAA